MKIFNDRANVEMIPMVIYLFILVICFYFMIFSISPALGIIHELAQLLDPSWDIYVDVEAKYNLAVRGFFLFISLAVSIRILHLYMMATQKQRYTGGGYLESYYK